MAPPHVSVTLDAARAFSERGASASLAGDHLVQEASVGGKSPTSAESSLDNSGLSSPPTPPSEATWHALEKHGAAKRGCIGSREGDCHVAGQHRFQEVQSLLLDRAVHARLSQKLLDPGALVRCWSESSARCILPADDLPGQMPAGKGSREEQGKQGLGAAMTSGEVCEQKGEHLISISLSHISASRALSLPRAESVRKNRPGTPTAASSPAATCHDHSCPLGGDTTSRCHSLGDPPVSWGHPCLPRGTGGRAAAESADGAAADDVALSDGLMGRQRARRQPPTTGIVRSLSSAYVASPLGGAPSVLPPGCQAGQLGGTGRQLVKCATSLSLSWSHDKGEGAFLRAVRSMDHAGSFCDACVQVHAPPAAEPGAQPSWRPLQRVLERDAANDAAARGGADVEARSYLGQGSLLCPPTETNTSLPLPPGWKGAADCPAGATCQQPAESESGPRHTERAGGDLCVPTSPGQQPSIESNAGPKAQGAPEASSAGSQPTSSDSCAVKPAPARAGRRGRSHSNAGSTAAPPLDEEGAKGEKAGRNRSVSFAPTKPEGRRMSQGRRGDNTRKVPGFFPFLSKLGRSMFSGGAVLGQCFSPKVALSQQEASEKGLEKVPTSWSTSAMALFQEAS